MAKYLIARQLSGKKLVTNEGDDFGRLVDIEVNEVSGKIAKILALKDKDINTSRF